MDRLESGFRSATYMATHTPTIVLVRLLLHLRLGYTRGTFMNSLYGTHAIHNVSDPRPKDTNV